MIQIKHQVIDGETRDTKAVLGLDLQSAFDKVTHSAILSQVSNLNLGERSYEYIKVFLSGRTSELRAGDLKMDEKTLGSQGTPQGSVISPMLFNLVMIQVAKRLCQLEGLNHTIYADDITLWVDGGRDAHIESTLQTAVDAIEESLEGTGLRCSPTKSELLIYRPNKTHRIKQQREHEKIKIRTRDGNTIPKVSKIRVLGMTIEALGRNGGTVTRITGKAANATRLLKRVTNKKGGMKEENLTRLIHSFVLCHIAYVAAFHKWMKSEKNKLDILIWRAYKTALGLPETTNTKRLLQLGMHNTLDEIAEAQRTAQLERLSSTKAGRKILCKLGISYHEQQGPKRPVPDHVRRNVRVDPLPRNMHPDFNEGRRRARAKTLTDLHAKDPGARYVDAAEYAGRNGFAIAVVDCEGNLRASASTSSKQVEEAEEIAIALAIVDQECHTILTDSRQAVRNYAKGRIASTAAGILSRQADRDKRIRIKWFPAHAGAASEKNANHNETAHARARGLTDRAQGDGLPLWFSAKDRMTSYNELTKAFRLARRLLPPPCKGLSRSQAVLFRQLQTRTLPSPALLHRMYPESHPDDKCRVCRRETATFEHMLWDCSKHPSEANSGRIPPQLEEAMRSDHQETQLQAVQQVIEALARQEPREPATASDDPRRAPAKTTT
ncbi:uncharacterized protein LOC144153218 [Haemaphysalis longicornis]